MKRLRDLVDARFNRKRRKISEKIESFKDKLENIKPEKDKAIIEKLKTLIKSGQLDIAIVDKKIVSEGLKCISIKPMTEYRVVYKYLVNDGKKEITHGSYTIHFEMPPTTNVEEVDVLIEKHAWKDITSYDFKDRNLVPMILDNIDLDEYILDEEFEDGSGGFLTYEGKVSFGEKYALIQDSKVKFKQIV